jgi:pyrimidine and pyridine-specific 5'-nucleotidase
MDLSLRAVLALHTRKVLHYKRLLERAHASSAAQLHALQAEVGHLREQARQHQLQQTGGAAAPAPDALCVCTRSGGGYWSGWRDAGEPRAPGESVDLPEALKLRPGESGSAFRDAEVRRAVRSLPLDDRMRLYVPSFLFAFFIVCAC